MWKQSRRADPPGGLCRNENSGTRFQYHYMCLRRARAAIPVAGRSLGRRARRWRSLEDSPHRHQPFEDHGARRDQGRGHDGRPTSPSLDGVSSQDRPPASGKRSAGIKDPDRQIASTASGGPGKSMPHAAQKEGMSAGTEGTHERRDPCRYAVTQLTGPCRQPSAPKNSSDWQGQFTSLIWAEMCAGHTLPSRAGRATGLDQEPERVRRGYRLHAAPPRPDRSNGAA